MTENAEKNKQARKELEQKRQRIKVAVEDACLQILESEDISPLDKLKAVLILRGE